MSVRISSISVILAISFLQVSCVSYESREGYAAKLADTLSVQRNISDFSYMPVSSGEWAKFELGGDSNTFEFGSGTSFFAAFETANISLPASLEIRSAFNTVFQASGHVVLPTVLILDSEHSVISQEESQMRQTSAPSGGVEFSHQAKIGTNAAYIIIYSDPRTADRTIPWHFSFYASTPVNVGIESNTFAKVGLGGPMRIRVSPIEE